MYGTTAARRWFGATMFLALLALAGTASAKQDPTPAPERKSFAVRSTREDIRVDGKLDEQVWSEAPTFELAYETRPAENGPAPVKTQAWIAYDVNSLYVAFKAYDPAPSKIRARFSDRDNAFQDDFVGVVLDTFNDERRAVEFFVNPIGVQMDLTQSEHTGNEDSSWDAIWDSAGRVEEFGYTVEMRIPFSSLRFPASENGMTWGIDAVRIYPRDQRYRIGLDPLDRNNICYLCQASKLTGFQGIKPARSIEIDPTLTSSLDGARTEFPEGSLKNGDPSTEPGVSAKWGITPNVIFNGAVNPDFSQVEADIAQLDVNTQFALFYPEKRPFFLEGADIFETRFNALYSRNIADPSWGTKLSGKVGKDAFGLIVARDQQTNFLIPSSQSSDVASLSESNLSTMLRYRRDLFGETTGGFFYTGREGDGFHNRLLGGDILFRWKETEAARIELLGSQTKYPDSIAAGYGQKSGGQSDWAVRAVYQHTSRNWMYYFLYRDVGTDFRADLGFVPQVDFRQGATALEYAWYPEKSGWSEFRVGYETETMEDQGGQHLERFFDAYTWANGPRQSFVRLDLNDGNRFYNGETFNTDNVHVHGEIQAVADVFVSLDGVAGNEIDYAGTQQAKVLRLDPGARFNVGRHLRLNLDHSYEKLDVDDGTLFTANLSQVRATYQLNVRTFVRWIGQYLDIDRGLDGTDTHFFNQILFSYKINPQTVLFAGYSDNYVGNQQVSLTQQNRTVFLKVGYAWLM